MSFISSAASTLHQAALTRTSVDQLTLNQEFSLEEAYQIQHQVIEHRLSQGHQLIGVKMGFTSEAKMKQMGVNDMIIGMLTSDMLNTNGGTMSLSEFIHPRVEPEICFILNDDINEVLDENEVKSKVSGIAAAIEIIDSRYKNFKFSLSDVVADNCSSAALVVGIISEDVNNPLNNNKIQLNINGEAVETGSSADILGNPWKALAAATRLAKQYNIPLKKGMYVMAGAATSAYFAEIEQEISADVEGLESVFFRVNQ
ncbi:MAG: fumarylacetoacetate hydrolase family protein [Bacteroidia bacterium]|nr:fumarylacetoacetate hydrolase family protein [Bacteroidia bacterium]